MRIAISTLVTPARKTGVGNYIVHLLEGLQQVDQENDYFIFIGRDTRSLFSLHAPNFHPIWLPISHDPRWLMRPAYYLWQNSLIYPHLRRHKIDLLHLPNLLPLLVSFVPTVVTIHDLAEYHVAKYSPIRQAYRKGLPWLLARRASRVITVSHHTKKELMALTHIDSNKIDVTHEATSLAPAELTTSVAASYGLTKPYILYTGSALPHKNLQRLIQAFDLLKKRECIPHQLVFVGNHSHNPVLQTDLARSLLDSRNLIVANYVPDEVLPMLYQEAALFVLPSLYEGFGLPVLEAMTMGTPVVTSNISSLPEVAGDAAVLVDPFRVEAIADGMWAVLSDERLRQRLIAKGKQRASEFSWEQCARDTIRAYQKALSS